MRTRLFTLLGSEYWFHRCGAVPNGTLRGRRGRPARRPTRRANHWRIPAGIRNRRGGDRERSPPKWIPVRR